MLARKKISIDLEKVLFEELSLQVFPDHLGRENIFGAFLFQVFLKISYSKFGKSYLHHSDFTMQ